MEPMDTMETTDTMDTTDTMETTEPKPESNKTFKIIVTLQMVFNIIVAIVILIIAILSVTKQPVIVVPPAPVVTTTMAPITTTPAPTIFTGRFVLASKDDNYDAMAQNFLTAAYVANYSTSKPDLTIVKYNDSLTISITNGVAPAGVYKVILGATSNVDFGLGPRACVVTLLDNSTLKLVDVASGFSDFDIKSTFNSASMTMSLALPDGSGKASAIYSKSI